MASADGLCPHCLLLAGLGHEYAVVNVLGEGAHGTVYLAEQQPSGILVALKILSGTSSRTTLSRVARQSAILGPLANANVARTIDVSAQGDDAPYIASEYVRGSPITTYCHRWRVSRADRVQLLASVAALLRCAHEAGVTHGGIKPANVLVAGRGAAGSVKVTDFGMRVADAHEDNVALAALSDTLLQPQLNGAHTTQRRH